MHKRLLPAHETRKPPRQLNQAELEARAVALQKRKEGMEKKEADRLARQVLTGETLTAKMLAYLRDDAGVSLAASVGIINHTASLMPGLADADKDLAYLDTERVVVSWPVAITPKILTSFFAKLKQHDDVKAGVKEQTRVCCELGLLWCH